LRRFGGSRLGACGRLFLPDRLGLLIAFAGRFLTIAVLVEPGPEAIPAAIPRPEALLALRLTIEFLGGAIAISIGLGSSVHGTLDDHGLQIVTLALAGILAVLVVIAILAIGTAILLLKLLVVGLRRRKNTQVMLGVLEITFRHDNIAGSQSVPAKLQILVGDCLGGTANLHIRPVALIDTIERIAAPASASTAATMATITVAPALVVLPWSHTLLMLLSELLTG